MDRKFYVASVGDPNDHNYPEENLQRCIKYNCHVMSKESHQKGVFDDIKENSICFLKYNNKLIAYGEVEGKSKNSDIDFWNDKEKVWTYVIKVKEWIFYDKTEKRKGVENHGIKKATIKGSQMATIKEVNQDYGLQKMKEIDSNTDLYKKVLLELNTKNNMDKLLKLLEANKNLILTGAPGTGKTYLAKEIANEMIKSASNKKDVLTILKEKINSFVIDEELRKKQTETLKTFQEKFPIEKLKVLTLEEYCTGRSSEYPDNFCNWIENNLTKYDLGGFNPGDAKYYRIYWDKKNKEYVKSKFVENDSDEEAIRKVREKLFDLVANKNYEEFAKDFGNSFALKILSAYYPNEIFPMNAENHINNTIKLFNIISQGNLLEKNKAIFKWYKEQTIGKDITPIEFMNILYDNFNIKDCEILFNQDISNTSDQFGFVQFHPSYDYTDFVEGLRPTKPDENGNIGFELKNGIFKEFCKEAKKAKDKNFVFVIDEINRGEISKIFGELFFSIDPGYRGKIGSVKTQYSNLHDDINEMFYVPENVYIIGTMNDIDRSVESFDFAMRRRFVWKEITAKESQQMFDNESWKKEASERMDNLNAEIEKIEGLNSSYHIGAAYFKNNLPKYNDGEKWDKLWELHLKPLLSEYLRGISDQEEKLKSLKIAYDSK